MRQLDKRRSITLQIEQDAHNIHKHHLQRANTRTLQAMHAETLSIITILLMCSSTKCSNQASLLNVRTPLKFGRLVITATQQSTSHIFDEFKGNLTFIHIGWNKENSRNDPWLKQTSINIEYLSFKGSVTVILNKLINRDRESIYDGDTRIVKQQAIADQTSKAFPGKSQVGSLPHKYRSAILRTLEY